jgi:uncharacterized phage-associated protein
MAMHSATEVANWFVAKAAESGDQITHLKVQKLLYYAEAWTQTLIGEELFPETLQAWAHGPVVPEVFQEFKEHAWKPLPVPDQEKIPEISDQAITILQQVFDTYGDLPAKTLEDMTHQDQPWIKARGNLSAEERCEAVIAKSEIQSFFKNKYSSYLNG